MRFQKGALFLFTILVSQQVFSSWRNSSYVSVQSYSYSGDKTRSLLGTNSFGMTFLSSRQDERFKLIYGGSFIYSPANIYLDNSARKGNIASADLLLGAAMTPNPNAKIRPVLMLLGMIGVHSLELTSPPTGVSNQTNSLAYGYKISLGLEVQMGASFTLGGFADYVRSTASELAGKTNFPLDAFGLSLGFYY